ncbi:MAG: hypothetical protein ABSF81_07265 [Bacteroidales bacterium]
MFSGPIETVITDLRYGFISGALKETLKINKVERLRKTKIIDNYLTNKYLGIPIFIFFMWLTFLRLLSSEDIRNTGWSWVSVSYQN